MALSRREASLRPVRARRSRGHFGTVSVRSKLPPPCVPVSPSPVSREASRDFAALDRTFDGGRGQTANVGISSSTVSENIIDGLMFIFTSKQTLYFRRWGLDETPATVFLTSERGGRPQSFTQAASNELKLGKGG